MSEIRVAEDFNSMVRYPLITEKAVTDVELKNRVTLIIDPKANKKTVKRAVEEYFDVQVVKVNTLITPKGLKKAMIIFKNRDETMKVAIALGII